MHINALGAHVGGQHHHFPRQHVRVELLELQLHGSREIEEGLHDAFEPVDLGHQNVDVRLRVEAGVEFGAEQFQVEHHRVERVFDFVRHSGRNAVERGKFRGEIELRLQALEGLEIAQREQRAGGVAAIFEYLERGDARLLPGAVAGEGGHFLQRLARLIGALGQGRDRMAVAERFGKPLPTQREAPAAEQLLRFGAGHDHAAFAVEQQDALRQAPDDLLQLITDRLDLRAIAGETAPQLAQTLGYGLHLDVHRARLGDLQAFYLELLDALHGFAQRPEHHVRRNPRAHQADKDDDRSEDARQFDRRPQVFAELRDGDSRDQLGEGLVLEADRILDLIDVIAAPQVPQLAVPPR